jgi:ATP-binding cassette subfamily C protein CydD
VSPIDRRLFSYCPAAGGQLYASVAGGVLAAALSAGTAVLLSHIIARVFLEGAGLTNVLPLLAGSLFLIMFRAGLLVMSEVQAQHAAGVLKISLRGALLDHITLLGPAYTQGGRSGSLVNVAVQAVDDLDEYVTAFLTQRYLAALVPLVIAFFVLLADPWSVLVLLFTGPLLVLFLVLIGNRAREMADRRFRDLGLLSGNFLDLLQGLPTLKLFGRSKEQVANLQATSHQYGATTMTVLRTAFETAFVLELSATVATALVAVEVGLRLAHGSIAFQPALAVLILTPAFFQPIRQLSLRYHAGASGRAAAIAIFAVLDTAPPSRAYAAKSPHAISAGIQFDHVSFAYENGRPVLHDVSFHIAPGSRTALVGPTGAGKTTIASLLLRFVEPQAGVITLDGQALDELDALAWRSRISWVPQQPHLFYGSVAENIRLARPGATGSEVADAAHEAGADAFIQDLPLGYDTLLGEEGAGLSGGELQRLAIARAFLKNAPYLVLDEPSSHLDAANEALILDALERLARGRTVLLIAHRQALLNGADQVLTLDGGTIVNPKPRVTEAAGLRGAA